MFGQQQNQFGGSGFGTTQTSAFSTPNTGGFGTPNAFGAQTPGTNLFGNAANTNTTGGLFGANRFGQPTTSSGTGFAFGGNSVFGSNNNTTTTSTAGGLFGTPATNFGTGTFGTKTAFGTGTTGGLFGQQPASTGSLFGQTTNTTTSGIFGTGGAGVFGASQSGTVIKFAAPNSQDTMVKNGTTQQMNTRHQVITAMKQYESKCFEELRLEDYIANRKGGSGPGILSMGMTQQDSKPAGLFGQANTTGGFSFGAQSKPPFGSTTGFGTTNTLFGQNTQQQQGGLFGAAKPTFGPTTQSTSMFGNTATTSLFGQNTQQKSLFGQPTTTQTTTPLFGGATNTFSGANTFGGTTFGTNTFGQQNQAAGGLFNKPTVFGTNPVSTGLNFGTQGNSLFGNQNKPGGLTIGGGTTTGFGQNTDVSLFGNKGTTAFGTGLGTGSTFGPSLGSTFASGNTMFGGNNKTTSFGSTFGNPGLNLGGGFGNTGLNTGGVNTQLGGNVAAQTAQNQLHLMNLLSNPYGDNPLFRNNLSTKDNTDGNKKPTNFAGQKPLNIPCHYKVSPRQTPSAKPISRFSNKSWKAKLFEGLEEDDPTLSPTLFVPRRSVKKLVIKKKTDVEENYVNDSTLFGKSLAADNFLIERASVYPDREKDRDDVTPRQKSLQDGELSMESTTPSKKRSSPTGGLFSADVPTYSSKEDVDPNCTVSDFNPAGGSKPTKKSLESSPKIPLKLQESTSDLDQSSFVELPDEQENVAPSHPAGVVLNRQGYYCIPPLEELATITQDGICEVENFTIGREGYGSVFFPGVTDVSNINLDDIVYFRRKEITVYPDDDLKPAHGQELNKRAEVTLDRTWPVDKHSRLPITDIHRLKALCYEEKLERATSKLGAKFIEYRPETGSWVFEVPHFSKYSLQDDEEDDSEGSPDQEKKKKQDGQQQISKKLPLQEKHLQPKVAHDNLQREASSQRQTDSDVHGAATRRDAFVNDKPSRGLGGQSVPSSFLLGGQVVQPPEGDEVMEAFDVEYQTQEEEEGGEEQGYDQPQAPPGYDAADDAAPLVPQQRLADTLGISTHRMQVMKASFFQEPQAAVPAPSLYGKAHSSFLGHQGYRPDTSVHSFSQSFQEKTSFPNQGASYQPPPMNGNRSFLTSKGFRGSPDPGYDMEMEPFRKRRPQTSGLFSSPQTSGILLSSFHFPHQRRMDTSTTEQPTKMVGARPIQRQVPLAKSLINKKTHLLADFGCVRERTFRVGWSSSWNVTHSGHAVGQQLTRGVKPERVSFTLLPAKAPTRASVEAAPYSVSMEKVHVSSHAQPGDRTVKALHINLLKVNLAHSLGAEERGCPMFTLSRGVGAIHDYATMVRKDLDQKLSKDLLSLEHSHQVFDLLVALWGQLEEQGDEEDVDKCSYVYQKMRRTAFSKWLADTASDVVQREVQDSKFKDLGNVEAVFSLLTGHQIAQACEVAQQSGDHRLALLLAQAGSTREVRQLVATQLVDWKELKADQFIASEYLKVYALLAGILVWPSSKGDINTCEGLDWKRALAIHLWHHCSATASVAEALSEYESAFTGQSSSGMFCKRPAPPYMEKNESLFVDASSERVFDTCYHLLKLYSDRTYPLEKVLAPPCHSSHHLDYRISWHVMQSLEALGYSHLSEKHSAHLHTSYAAQLESMGLWHWAIFVLLHITDVNRREAAVRGMLERHASLEKSAENESIESFLVENLHIQPAWIHQAKALRAFYENKPHDRAWHLQQAEQWNDCHQVVMRHIAADCIINENYTYLRSYLDVLGMEENSCLIQDWRTNGQVYLEFIRIRERISELEEGDPSVAELEKLQPDIASLCQRVGSVICSNSKDRLSVAEMSKRTANMMKIVLSLQQGSEMKVDSESREPGPIQSHLLVPHINKLPLPEDYTLQELRQLARSCLVELAS